MSLITNRQFSVGAGVAVMVYKGECFWVISGPKTDPGREHRHVALGTAKGTASVVFLSVQSKAHHIHKCPDRYMKLFQSDHDFLAHDSYVDFYKAKDYPAEYVRRCAQNGKEKNWRKAQGFAPEIVDKLIVAFCESAWIKPTHRKILAEAYAAIKVKSSSKALAVPPNSVSPGPAGVAKGSKS